MLHCNALKNDRMKCTFRLTKIVHSETTTFYWIEYPVKLFGITLWWNTTTDAPYDDEESAKADLKALCSKEHWEKLEHWKKENNH